MGDDNTEIAQCAPEKLTTSNSTSSNPRQTNEKAGFVSSQKEVTSGETLPGWTIMRSFRKGGRGKDQLKTTASNTTSSGDGYGIGEALQEVRSDDELLQDGDGVAGRNNERHNADDTVVVGGGGEHGARVYKVYKRRWFGLLQIVLLNIIVSWDVSEVDLSPDI